MREVGGKGKRGERRGREEGGRGKQGEGKEVEGSKERERR